MGAINNAFNKASLSILYLADSISKYRSKLNEEGQNRAKQSYSTAATIKKQNNELTKNQSEPPRRFFDDNSSLPPKMDEQKIAEQKVLDEMTQAKATSFGELPTVSAENSETNISAKDPEVQGLIQAKQKNMNRAISASRAQKEYQASKGYENDFPIRDYMPDVSDAELRKAGITKTELNKLSSILAGNGTDEDVRNWFEKHGGADGAYTIKLDDLYVTKQAADAIKNYILNKDEPNDIDSSVEAKDLKQPSVDDWYLNFDRNNNTMSNSDNYKVWQDDSTEEEKDEIKTDRNFSGIKF